MSDDTQEAIDLATTCLRERHMYPVPQLSRAVLVHTGVASALRELLDTAERERDEARSERDEARARIARYVAAVEARTRHDYAGGGTLWYAERDRLDAACVEALAALRETPASEGGRC